MFSQHHTRRARRARAVVAVQVAVILFVLIGFAALTVDVGVLYNTKGDLQRTADAAALAAASQLSDYSTGSPVEPARDAAVEFTVRNQVFNHAVTIDPLSDVIFGRATYDANNNVYDFAPTEVMPDAVQVRVRHTADSPNGSVGLYFARVFGVGSTELSAQAIAVMVPRDIAIVADLSASHSDDSELRNYQLTDINLRDVWNDLPGGADDIAACASVSCGIDETCVNGSCVTSGPGALAGPAWGFMKTLGFGPGAIPSTYNPATDPGLIGLTYNQNWVNAQLSTYLTAQGYIASERNAILSKTNDPSGAWQYRTAVALGLAYWNSGIPGGRWSKVGAAPGNNNTNVQSNELQWSEQIMGRSVAASKTIWLDYINNYMNQTWTEMYGANSAFKYKFGLKTFTNYLMERRVSNSKTPELAHTRHQPMQAVKDAVTYMTTLMGTLDTDDQLSLEIYGTTARHEVNLTMVHHLVSDRLNNLQAGHYDSYTNMGGGIEKGIAELGSIRARSSAQKVLVVLTDGNANCDQYNNCGGSEQEVIAGNNYAIDATEAAAALGIRIFAISVGADSNPNLMQQIADIGQGEHFHASGTVEEYSEQLQVIFERIAGRRPVELIR